ncbi:aldo/keto reductase [Rhizobium giardinii]|uniref:aldo/keto reductase n=1 Tax=Rhizobium giardinii TaxID=56731 RepID=UPI0039E0EB73
MPMPDAGGKFIDTADIYQFGQSEELLGSLLQGRRENCVLATKYTNGAVPNADRLVTGTAAGRWSRPSRAASSAQGESHRHLLGASSRCRSLTQLTSNLGAITIELSSEQLDRLDSASSLDPSAPVRNPCHGLLMQERQGPSPECYVSRSTSR